MRMLKKTEFKSLAAKSMVGVFGNERVKRLLLKRNFDLYEKAGAIFIHVPKVAGTTISTALYGKTLGHFQARDFLKHDCVAFENLFVFAFLRNPVERVRSSYHYARSGGTEQGMIAYRKEYSEAIFSDFETFATQWLPSQPVDKIDLVFQPQSDFLLNNQGELLTDKLYRLDRIQSAWKDICKNSSPIHVQLKSKNVNKNRTAAYQPISSNVREALERYYRKDFELWDSLS